MASQALCSSVLFLIAAQILLSSSVRAQSGISCSSLASISLSVTQGRCSASGRASCEAVSAQLVQVNRDVNTLFEGNPCVQARVNSAARSIATAIASVWASSLVQITCNGKARGCGTSASQGNALSIAWTEAVAVAVAAAGDANQFGVCVADFRAAIPALALAFANTKSQVCVSTNGQASAIAYQRAAISAAATVIGDAFASATAQFCGKEVSTECEGEAGQTGPGNAGVNGEVSGGVNVTPGQGSGSATGGGGGSAQAPFHTSCHGFMEFCCHAPSYPCSCNGCGLTDVTFEGLQSTPFGQSKLLKQGSTLCLCNL